MAEAKHNVGDLVFLGNGPFKQIRSDTEYRIVAVLPVSNGQIQYQVRSVEEGFDRRVGASDIDLERSVSSNTDAPSATAATPAGSWLKPLSIKTHK